MRRFTSPREHAAAIAMLEFFGKEPKFIREMYAELEPKFPDVTRDRMRSVCTRLRDNHYLERRAGGTKDLVIGITRKGRATLQILADGGELY